MAGPRRPLLHTSHSPDALAADTPHTFPPTAAPPSPQGAHHQAAGGRLPTPPAPLLRQPFEFCSPAGTASSGGGGNPAPSAAAAPAAPRSALFSQLAAAAAGGGAGAGTQTVAQALQQQPQQPAMEPETPRYGAAMQHAQQARQAQQGGPAPLPAGQQQEKKKKKHGRLWRFVHGVPDEDESSMHQPLW